MHKSIILITTVFLLLSCSSEENEVILFQTDFENDNAMDGFVIPNDGTFKITNEEKINGNGCLETHSSCSSLMVKRIGPLDADYKVRLEAWIKSQYGAEIYLVVSDPEYKIIKIETSSDYETMRKWNFFSKGSLDLKEGQEIQLIIDPSHSIFANSWYDDVKVIGEPN